jgi:hypothetical protein
MILTSALAEKVEEVQIAMLRDQNIEVFDDNREQKFKLESLCNIECLFLSHN